LRADGVVSTGQDGEADYVHVFLDGGGGDHLGGLAEAGVDDFHAGIAQGAGDYLRAAVVAVQAGLGNQHSDFLLRHYSRFFRAAGYQGALRVQRSPVRILGELCRAQRLCVIFFLIMPYKAPNAVLENGDVEVDQ
jgi:hypothetical protein